ncbi:hypothetical protein CARUB_v10005185mg [Capsella rubella]|uniref:F-box domain-containing protein n=1 Tax=Capsella rubella TaxID=81985 RepID=R0F5B2_9BRAS|nr:hypothetical protein CARUB_v10005185mg [Capsella rubella]
MDEEDGERRVRAKPSGDGAVVEVDKLRNLPDSLLHQILLKLPTKDVVKCSVLSHRWRNLWRYVPGLDLQCGDFMVSDCDDFSDFMTLLGFVYRFLGFNSESCLREFKLTVDSYKAVELGTDHFTHWINTVVKRKVQHLNILDKNWEMNRVVIRIPGTVYSCESLVSLTLRYICLPNPPELVSLPSLKVIVLDGVEFDNDLALEMLILGCPVLESLSLNTINMNGNLEYLQVCSQSLLSFTYVEMMGYMNIIIDAPRLEYLRLSDKGMESFIIENHGSLVKADIDTEFDLSFDNESDPYNLPKRHMIRNFLVGISCVKDMSISSSTLEVIYVDFTIWMLDFIL